MALHSVRARVFEVHFVLTYPNDARFESAISHRFFFLRGNLGCLGNLGAFPSSSRLLVFCPSIRPFCGKASGDFACCDIHGFLFSSLSAFCLHSAIELPAVSGRGPYYLINGFIQYSVLASVRPPSKAARIQATGHTLGLDTQDARRKTQDAGRRTFAPSSLSVYAYTCMRMHMRLEL